MRRMTRILTSAICVLAMCGLVACGGQNDDDDDDDDPQCNPACPQGQKCVDQNGQTTCVDQQSSGSSGSGTLGGLTSGGQTSGSQTSGGQTSGSQTSGGQTSGGQTLGCSTLLLCLNNCDSGDDTCVQNCWDSGTPQGKQRLQATISCQETNCSGGGSSCLCQQCTSQLQDCGVYSQACSSGGTTSGTSSGTTGGGMKSCRELAACIGNCPSNDDTCFDQCFGSSTQSARQQFTAVASCSDKNCPNGQNSCICSSCRSSLQTCGIYADICQ